MARISLTDLPDEILVHIFSYLYEPWDLVVRPAPTAHFKNVYKFCLPRKIQVSQSLTCRSLCSIVQQAARNAFTKTLEVSMHISPRTGSYIASHTKFLSQVETIRFPNRHFLLESGQTLVERMPSVQRLICGPSCLVDAEHQLRQIWTFWNSYLPWCVSLHENRGIRIHEVCKTSALAVNDSEILVSHQEVAREFLTVEFCEYRIGPWQPGIGSSDMVPIITLVNQMAARDFESHPMSSHGIKNKIIKPSRLDIEKFTISRHFPALKLPFLSGSA